MNRTENFQLCQWEPEDRILRSDFVADNAKLDTALTAHRDALAGLAVSDAGKQEKVTASGVLAGDGAGHVDAAGAAELYTLMSSLAAVTDPVDADKLLLADVSGETAGFLTIGSLMSGRAKIASGSVLFKANAQSNATAAIATLSLPFPAKVIMLRADVGGLLLFGEAINGVGVAPLWRPSPNIYIERGYSFSFSNSGNVANISCGYISLSNNTASYVALG